MEGGSHVDVGRIDRATLDQPVAVDGVDAQEQRDAQPALPRDLLEPGSLLHRQDVEEGAHASGANLLGHVGMAEVLVLGVHIAMG